MRSYTIVSVDSPNGLTIASSAGTHSGLAYFFWAAKTSIGGLVGAFTDADGNVLSNFDWAGYGGLVNPATSLSVTSVNPGGNTYNGTFPGGASNAYKGTWFVITGFTKSVNNGTYYCLGSSTSGLNLQNARAVQETHAATAQQLSFVTLQAPAGAAFLSLGINDTELHDNTGSFTLNAVLSDTFGWFGDVNPFAHDPGRAIGWATVRWRQHLEGHGVLRSSWHRADARWLQTHRRGRSTVPASQELTFIRIAEDSLPWPSISPNSSLPLSSLLALAE